MDSFTAQLLALISIAHIDSLFVDSFAAQSPQSELPLVGNVALDFKVEAVFDQEFIKVKLSEYIGKKYVVLFFYPLDSTFVCLTEITAFSDRYEEFKQIKINTEVLGVSVDSVSEQRLRKAVSYDSYEIDKYETSEDIATIDEVKQAECECCGLKEDCTPDYISEVKGSYSGNWVCGLCSEAVKERMAQGPKVAMHEAVCSHKDFCQKFNTTRVNPQLSLTCAMRDIAKRSSENRSSKNSSTSRIARSTSCVPRINLNH